MSNYLKRLDVVHSRLANAALPHMTDETLEGVVAIFDKYQPRQAMTPQDSVRWLNALKEGYERKNKAEEIRAEPRARHSVPCGPIL